MAKRPRDPNQLAKLIVDIAAGEAEDTISDKKRRTTPVRGSLGGIKGGKARAASLTIQKRSEIAQKAAKARWQRDIGYMIGVRIVKRGKTS